MKEKLTEKIQELSKEASRLVDARERFQAEIQEIEIRLHQITGAIIELDKLIKVADTEQVSDIADKA